MTFDAAAIRAWTRNQERCRDAYYNGTRCDVCGHRSKSAGTVCGACKQAAYRARKQAEQ